MKQAMILAVLAALWQEDPAAAARLRAIDAHARCITQLSEVDGISSVNYAGAGADYRLMIVVRDTAAKLAAQKKIGGDTWEGLPILWTVTQKPFTSPQTTTIAAPPPAAAAAKQPEPAAAPANSTAAPQTPSIPDCDIVRAQVGLPAVRRPVGGGSWKSWIPCKVWLRAVQGPGGGHSYLYTKHRPGCPFMDGLISPVYREGFLYPTELRGDDGVWMRQVQQDLDGKFPPTYGPAYRRQEVPSEPRR
jgi:hypothetical protein